jgi:hypothetical protein
MNWFLRLLDRSTSCRTTRARKATARLTVEALEDRLVPTSFTAASVPDLIADINAANAAGGSNTIVLASGARFTLTAADNSTDGPTGLPVVAANDDLMILGSGNIVERSTASGTPQFRLLDVAAGGSLTLESLTLQGGVSQEYWDSGRSVWVIGRGGAALSQGGLTLNNVTVQNNAARGYGFNYADQFPGGDGLGGGVCSAGSLTVNGGSIQNNSATGGRGADGFLFWGGFPVPGEHGGNGQGGAIYVAGGTASVTGANITGNTAQGGLGGAGYYSTGGSSTGGGGGAGGVGNSSTGASSAGGIGGSGEGGGIYVAAGTVAIDSSAVAGNTA